MLLSVIGFLASWAFIEIATMPKTYASKADLQCLEDRIGRGLARIYDSLDDINRFLRDRGDHR